MLGSYIKFPFHILKIVSGFTRNTVMLGRYFSRSNLSRFPSNHKLGKKEVEAKIWEKLVFLLCAKAGLYFIPDLISMYSLDFVFNDFCVSSMHVNSVSTFI